MTGKEVGGLSVAGLGSKGPGIVLPLYHERDTKDPRVSQRRLTFETQSELENHERSAKLCKLL